MSEEVKSFESRCKVCTSPNRSYFEDEYFKSDGKITWTKLEELAHNLNEDISLQSFKRHFERHFSQRIHEFMSKEETIEKVVEHKKTEAVNAVEEIKNNLEILRTLMARAENLNLDNAASVTAWGTLLREHRQTIEACERLSSSLKSKVGITREELVREIIRAAKDLCADCQEKFMIELDKRLREKGIE